MKPHPRIRTMVKWGGPIVAGVLIAAWAWSGWGELHWISRRGPMIGLQHGLLFFGETHWRELLPKAFDSSGDFGWRWYPSNSYHLEWRFERAVKPMSWSCSIPLWFLCGVFFVPAAVVWGQDLLAGRRDRTNRCAKCGYDLAGLPSGAPCPECGRGR